MKVISLLQPWATLVVMGAKKIETRSWNTKFRGEILIHASKKFTNEQHDICIFNPFYTTLLELDYFDETKPACGLPTGAIIGKSNLLNTFSTDRTLFTNEITTRGRNWLLTEDEMEFGDYSENRFGWLLKDAIEFAQPIPAKGSLGLWDYDLPDHIHIANKYGGHATFSQPPDKETMNAVNALTEAAYKKFNK